MKQTTCGHSFYIVHAKKTSSCFMRKIKCLKCFLLTFLKESVFTQWILWLRYEMSRTSDAKFSYLWFYRNITFIIFLYSLDSALSAQFQGEISQSNVKCNKFYKGLKLISYSPTIIVKSVGKVAFYTSSFPSSPCPWPNVDQNVNVCAPNCSVISQHWIEGTGDI